MPLLDTEANVELRNVLMRDWDASNISESFNTAWISTGRFDEETPNPQVTLSIVSEDASPTGIDPSGQGLTSWVDGVIECNVWVPYDRDEYASQGVAKQFRYELVKEVHRIVENNYSGTTDSNNDPVLTRLEPGEVRRDPVEPPPPFRALLPIGFNYHTAPE